MHVIHVCVCMCVCAAGAACSVHSVELVSPRCLLNGCGLMQGEGVAPARAQFSLSTPLPIQAELVLSPFWLSPRAVTVMDWPLPERSSR